MFHDLEELIAQPTTQRTEGENNNEPQFEFNEIEFDSLEFDEPEMEDSEDFEEEEAETIDLTPYDPVEAANNLVALLTSANHLITPLARWKLTKKRGGKKKIQVLQNSFSKQINGQELTEQDKKQIAMYQSYLKDKEQLEAAIPFTDDEFDTLLKQAIPYCRANKIKVGGGASFWTTYGMMQAQRVFQILQA